MNIAQNSRMPQIWNPLTKRKKELADFRKKITFPLKLYIPNSRFWKTLSFLKELFDSISRGGIP